MAIQEREDYRMIALREMERRLNLLDRLEPVVRAMLSDREVGENAETIFARHGAALKAALTR